MDLPPRLSAILGEAHICVFSAPDLSTPQGHLQASSVKNKTFISPHPSAFSFSSTKCPLSLKEFPLELVICEG